MVVDRSTLTFGGVLAITGFLVVTSVLTGRVERAREEPRRAQLIDLIGERQQDVDDLDAAVEQLRDDVLEAQQGVTRADALERRVADRFDRLGALAGTVPLHGRGLVVRLAPSEREPPSPDEAGAYEIHDTDVQLVVNALFGSGAEAVAINGSRLVATTPIRAAGDTVIVNFRPLSPPYRIVAIGAARRTFLASDIARRFDRWTELFGLGFSVDEDDDLTVPGFTGRVSISTASPAGPRAGG
jgi:uncharacterized protein YlxW (UPF0749 family)